MKKVWAFIKGCFTLLRQGSKLYYSWIYLLLAFIIIGVLAYANQMYSGLITTAMRDQVSWGFYISNFTFMVGVAAAAVLLVIPAYVYQWKPIKEIAILGELVAVSAMVMCLLFVTVDLGRPERFWHLIPKIGIGTFFVLLVSGQVLAGMVFGYFGLFGVPATALTLGKLLGAAMVIGGVWLVTFR